MTHPRESTCTCSICATTGEYKEFTLHERYIGLGTPFTYFQCNHCKCLQIKKVPDNLEIYYPASYYSFNSLAKNSSIARFKNWIKQCRDNTAWTGKGIIGKFVLTFMPFNSCRAICNSLPDKTMSILDIGCGNGMLLHFLADRGYRNLTGIDPFIERDTIYKAAKIFKKELLLLTGQFDFIMMHHAFEHMEHHKEILCKLKTLLKPTGTLLLRIPTVTSFAWEKYGDYWVNLDAPRHLSIHSHQSIRNLAEVSGFVVDDMRCDSTPFQFWGSSLYKLGIPLATKGFAKKCMRLFLRTWYTLTQRDTVCQLNRTMRGDEIAVYLRHQK